ncbi:unnamed protein product [Lymnaea stagnalis]|uniref:Arginine kinase n=1 Tax=Lymnaea stagnalis TaxID=6523 RepID=A0AAV2HYC1_LYMST
MSCCTGQVNNIKEAERLAGLLNNNACNSLLKKHLTKERLDALKKRKTKLGGQLAHCIVSGCLNLDSSVGIYACDPEAYTTFSDLFDPIIKDYHKTDVLNHPKPYFGADELKCGNLDKSGTRIVSTRVRVARSHNGFPFPPLLTVEKRLQMERMTVAALKLLKGELAGTYYPLSGMSKEEEEKLVKDHFLFNDSNR